MADFLTLLAFTYLCNGTAEVRLLAPPEAAACTSAYEGVKRHFYPEFEVAPLGSPERIAQNATAYAGFKAWEADNAALVATMRADARRAAGEGQVIVGSR